jgi:DNA-binding CsgD family transcriptional regulator
MINEQHVLSLIGDIYDASLDPALWPAILEKICGFIPGSMANLFSQDSVNKNANRYFTWGDDPHYTSLYLEKYAALNPLFPTGLFFPVGEVYGQADIMPYEELSRTRFYKEWLEPQGFLDFVGCNLDKSATSCAPIAVIRHKRNGFVDDETRRRMAVLVPHVRRAVLIGNAVDLHKVEAATLADVLDGLAAGMFLVDGHARIIHANAAGHAMLGESVTVRPVAGQLVANDPQANELLRDTFAAANAGDAAIGVKGIAVPITARDGERYVAHVLPLTSAARRQANVSYAAAAAVFVQKATIDPVSLPDAISRQFRLTAAELRVLLTIVNLGGVVETAESLGIAEATVRTHLHRLFEKTGTGRQADLVKLVAGFTNRLVR